MFAFLPTDGLTSGGLSLILERTAGAQPEKRWLPAYHFAICLEDGTRVGACVLRVGHNDKTAVGGNIGYAVDPPFRGHHYAARACALLFRLARKHGMDHVIITCDPANAASARTCALAGARFLGLADVPPDNEMYASGRRTVMVWRAEV